MPFLVNGDAWTADYGFTLNAADRFLPHLSSVPYGSDHVDHVPLFFTMSCLRCFHPQLFWQLLVTVIKSFTLYFSFFRQIFWQQKWQQLDFLLIVLVPAELFYLLQWNTNYLFRSHFSSWVIQMFPQMFKCSRLKALRFIAATCHPQRNTTLWPKR